jgi:hypothetical protein
MAWSAVFVGSEVTSADMARRGIATGAAIGIESVAEDGRRRRFAMNSPSFLPTDAAR